MKYRVVFDDCDIVFNRHIELVTYLEKFKGQYFCVGVIDD